MKRFILFIFFFGCSVSNKININCLENSDIITFNKISVNFNKGETNLNFKTILKIYKDSIVKYKIIGPLGIDLLNGFVNDSFHIYKSFNDSIEYKINFIFKEILDLRVPNKFLQYLFLGKFNELTQILNNDVHKDLRINLDQSKRNITKLFLQNEKLGWKIECHFYIFKDFPKKIKIFYKDRNESFKLSMEILSLQC